MKYRFKVLDREGAVMFDEEIEGTGVVEMEAGRFLQLPDLFELRITVIEEQGNFGFTYERGEPV